MIDAMTIDSKKAVLTDENREESAKLKKIWDARKHTHGLNQAEFGDRFGIGTQGAVSACLRGNMAISLKAGTGFALGLRCDVAEFSPRLAAMAGAVNLAAIEAMSHTNEATEQPTNTQQHRQVYAVQSTPLWPFEMFSFDEWMSLPKKDREDYEALIYGAVHRARKTRRHN